MSGGRSRQREEDARLTRRADVARRYLEGQSQLQIGQALEVSQPTISRDLDWLRAQWQAAFIDDYRAFVLQELAKLDHLEATFWERWHTSVETGATTRRVIETDADGRTTPRQLIVDSNLGDKRWLDGVAWVIDRRCRLLGLDAPERHAVAGVVSVHGADGSRHDDWDPVADAMIRDPEARRIGTQLLARVGALQAGHTGEMGK